VVEDKIAKLCRVFSRQATWMRFLVAAAIVCVASSAGAQTPDPPRHKILVLPLAPTHAITVDTARAFDARLLVALDDTRRIQTLTHDEDSECTTLPCLASLGTKLGASYVLSLAVVPEGGTMTLFGTLVDVKTATAWRRIELPRVTSNTLAKAPPELVPQILGTPAGSTVLSWVKPTSVPGVTAANAVHDQLVALKAFKVIPIDGVDRSPPTHRAELTVNELTIAEPRRALCKWYDGTLVATFSITDLSNGRVVWTKTVTSRASERVHFSSRSDVIDQMVERAVADWMTAFRAAGVLKPKRG
jgi:hypothetical protein